MVMNARRYLLVFNRRALERGSKIGGDEPCQVQGSSHPHGYIETSMGPAEDAVVEEDDRELWKCQRGVEEVSRREDNLACLCKVFDWHNDFMTAET